MPQAAAERWQSIITQGSATDFPAGAFDWSGGEFGAGFSYTGPVNDIVIFYQITPIDGQSGILGSAGPIFLRSGEATPLFSPISAQMQFDYCKFLFKAYISIIVL